jgi:uncharacterized membrane protein
MRFGLLIKQFSVLLFVIMVFHIYASVYASIQDVTITVESDGSAWVEMSVSILEGLNTVPLPVRPIPETIKVLRDGTSIPPIYSNMTIVVPSDYPGVVVIRYDVDLEVSGGVISMDVGGYEATLIVGDGIVLLSMPQDILGAETVDGRLRIVFRGPTTISYTLAAEEVEEAPPPTYLPEFPIWIYLLPILVIVGVVLFFLLRRGSSSNEFDELDRDILEALRRSGGKMLQSELMSELRVPKTTLWRHVKRLERLGYIEINQVGRVNIIILKK